MESSPDLATTVLGMVRATITRVLGPDALQASPPSVRVVDVGSPTPRVEIALRYGGESRARTFVLPAEPDRVALEKTVNNAVLPMLEDMGLLSPAAETADDPPLGQPGAGQAD
ncbi:MAG TPA: hypothetical protein VK066_15620 [Chloroflexota bacterium]|nr:hypothetical protein [Chloroflexota bacterium]